MNKEELLHPLKHVRGGAYLDHSKNTAESESVVMPPPMQVCIPMQQHIGAPCVPCVKKGDTVFVGSKIGDSDEYISAPIHSSISGTVKGIETVLMPSGEKCEAVVIESDGFMKSDPSLAPVTIESAEDLIKAARDCGLVGLGGAGFPTHVKLSAKTELDTLIINGAECEPFITSDYRECIENAENILEGVYLLKKILKFKQVIICIEDNKPKAIDILYKIVSDAQDEDNSVKLLKLKSHYPQGAEKVLIYSATGKKLPFGKLPADIGCVVMNITSVSVLNRYVKTGMPLVSKTITVDGAAVSEPKNVVVPIGTRAQEVLDFCGGFKTSPYKVVMGGPMMGVSLLDLSMPILKQNNAILAFDRKQGMRPKESPCIRCGRCASICPMNLQPLEIESSFRIGDIDRVKSLYVEYCMECGCCSYTCPSKRHLTQVMRMAKAELKKRG